MSGGYLSKGRSHSYRVAACLTGWVVHRHDFLDVSEVDPSHGTLVGGVLVAARDANGNDVGREEDGSYM